MHILLGKENVSANALASPDQNRLEAFQDDKIIDDPKQQGIDLRKGPQGCENPRLQPRNHSNWECLAFCGARCAFGDADPGQEENRDGH